jgi:hypothetical protein
MGDADQNDASLSQKERKSSSRKTPKRSASGSSQNDRSPSPIKLRSRRCDKDHVSKRRRYSSSHSPSRSVSRGREKRSVSRGREKSSVSGERRDIQSMVRETVNADLKAVLASIADQISKLGSGVTGDSTSLVKELNDLKEK